MLNLNCIDIPDLTHLEPDKLKSMKYQHSALREIFEIIYSGSLRINTLETFMELLHESTGNNYGSIEIFLASAMKLLLRS